MSKVNTRATINANIKQNGNQEITGQILNSVLNTMVDDYAEQEKLTELGQKVTYISVNKGKNLLDTSASVDGYLNADGTIHANSGTDWKTTDFIDVSTFEKVTGSCTEKGKRVAMSLYFLVKYDSNKNVLGRDTSQPTTVTIPEGTAFIRFSYHNAAINPMVEEGATRTEYEPYYEKTEIPNLDLTNIINAIKDGSFLENRAVKGRQTDFIGYSHGKNLLDTSKSVDGYLNANGTIHSNSGVYDWKTSDFIDLEDFESITASVTENGTRKAMALYFLVKYDSNKEALGQDLSQPTTYTIPKGVAYIRFSYHLAAIDPMVEEGTTITAYEAYKIVPYLIGAETQSTKKIFDGKKWAVFGDSLTEKNIRATKSYYDYIADDTGISIVNYGVSGTGYARTESNFMTRMLNINPSAFDVLTIFGSFNDAGANLPIGEPTDTGTTTLCGCINATIDNFYSVAPFKPIGLITPCPWKSIPPDNAWGNQYADAIIAIAKRRGIPCLDLFRKSGLRPWAGSAYIAEYYTENGVADTGVHPNSKGHKVFLYPHFSQFLKTLLGES